jgi:hypothetical protein
VNLAPSATVISVPSSSQVSEILPPQKLLVGTNTTFVEITKRVSKLYETQKEARALARTAKAAGHDGKVLGMGIDIFTWR